MHLCACSEEIKLCQLVRFHCEPLNSLTVLSIHIKYIILIWASNLTFHWLSTMSKNKCHCSAAGKCAKCGHDPKAAGGPGIGEGGSKRDLGKGLGEGSQGKGSQGYGGLGGPAGEGLGNGGLGEGSGVKLGGPDGAGLGRGDLGREGLREGGFAGFGGPDGAGPGKGGLAKGGLGKGGCCTEVKLRRDDISEKSAPSKICIEQGCRAKGLGKGQGNKGDGPDVCKEDKNGLGCLDWSKFRPLLVFAIGGILAMLLAAEWF